MGFDTNLFVQQPVEDSLICSICHEVMKAPTTICGNGHTYCGDCILEWDQGRGHQRCPDCRLNLNDTFMVCRPLQSIIHGLKVRCPAKNKDDPSPGKGQSKKRAKVAPISEANPNQCAWEGTLASYLEKHKPCECNYGRSLQQNGCRVQDDPPQGSAVRGTIGKLSDLQGTCPGFPFDGSPGP
jgi:RING-type zinc-finger